MALPSSYLDFNNPIHIIWRKGTPDDPFVERLDITRVVNQRIALLEIPDELYRVRISGLFEINYEKFIKNQLAENEFYCDYTNGFVYFHKKKEAETISILYKGRGVILYPSNRILHFDGTNGSETLYEIIERSKLQVKELIDRTDNYEEYLDRLIVATNLTREATDEARKATDDAKKATELVNDAYYTTVLIYQPYVNTYMDILTQYPNPHVGWTVQVYDTGIRYRFNGDEWIPIDALGGNVPLATHEIDGLMSKEHFIKMEDISDETDFKTIIFVCPQDILEGVQDPHIVFPYTKAEILEVKAYVSKKGTFDTPIDVEISKDFENWSTILDSPLNINPNEHEDNGLHTLARTQLVLGDVLRLKVLSFDCDALNLTVNIKLKID